MAFRPRRGRRAARRAPRSRRPKRALKRSFGGVSVRRRRRVMRNPNAASARPRSTAFLPKTRSMALVYRDVDSVLDTSIAHTTAVVKQISCNSIHDVDPAVAAIHRPYLYKQVISFYGAEKVTSSGIKVTFVNTSGSPAIVGIYLSASGDTPLTAQQLYEHPRVTWKWVGNTAIGGDRHVTTLSMNWTQSRSRGQGFNAARTDANVNTSPWNKTATPLGSGREMFFNIFHFWPSHTSSPSATIVLNIQAVYKATFAQPKEVLYDTGDT